MRSQGLCALWGVCAHEASAAAGGEDLSKGPPVSSAAAESQLAVCDMGDPRHEWTKQLRGTIWERHGGDLAAAEAELAESGAVFAGSVHERLRDMAAEYGGNFCIARTSAGNGVGPQLEPWLVVSDPEDAVEISKRHLKKARIYQYVPPCDPLQAWERLRLALAQLPRPAACPSACC